MSAVVKEKAEEKLSLNTSYANRLESIGRENCILMTVEPCEPPGDVVSSKELVHCQDLYP